LNRVNYSPAKRFGRRAFSLIEMMIALVVLGLGLIFIAAALPAGVRYAQGTVDQMTGEAAFDFAVEQARRMVRTSDGSLLDERYYPPGMSVAGSPAARVRRADGIFRPRTMDGLADNVLPTTLTTWLTQAAASRPRFYPPMDEWEPRFKVRPLVAGNLGVVPGDGNIPRRAARYVDQVETLISRYYVSASFGNYDPDPPTAAPEPLLLETDSLSPPGLSLEDADPAFPPMSLPVVMIPGTARVYPPVTPTPLTGIGPAFPVADFVDDRGIYQRYTRRYATDPDNVGETEAERFKALERRFAWTAFYRRVAYPTASPGAALNSQYALDLGPGAEDIPHAASVTFEGLFVVTRRPSVNHRFAVQSLVASGLTPFTNPTAAPPAQANDATGLGADVVAPMPWLVTFDPADNNALPQVTLSNWEFAPPAAREMRVLKDGFQPPASLTFKCTPEVGRLLPVGSIFIPACNDDFSYLWSKVLKRPNGALLGKPVQAGLGVGVRVAGFVPHSPSAAPVYTVIDRPDERTVITDNPGFYPWVQTGLNAAYWPVWVVPPAFSQRDGAGQPIFDGESSIVKWGIVPLGDLQ